MKLKIGKWCSVHHHIMYHQFLLPFKALCNLYPKQVLGFNTFHSLISLIIYHTEYIMSITFFKITEKIFFFMNCKLTSVFSFQCNIVFTFRDNRIDFTIPLISYSFQLVLPLFLLYVLQKTLSDFLIFQNRCNSFRTSDKPQQSFHFP